MVRLETALAASALATLLAVGWVVPLSAQAPASAAGESAAVQGRVVEAGTDRGVPAAWILVPRLGLRVQADDQGLFALPGVLAGATLVLRVEQLGYHPGEVVLLAGDEEWVVVELEPRPVELEGIEVAAGRVYRVREILERRVDRYRATGTVRGQLDLLTSDATDMVEYLWEEAKALLIPCPGERHAWEAGCLRIRGRQAAVELCVDDVTAPGGAAMLHMYEPADLYRVEVIPDNGQIRLYTRGYVAHLSRTGKVPPIWPRWLGGCMGGDVAWAPPSVRDGGG